MISIDPEARPFWAYWDQEGRLQDCGEWPCICVDEGDIAVIETQVIIPKFTKDPASIIKLAQFAGAVAATFGWPEDDHRVKWVAPRSWKQNTKKPKNAAAWASYAIHRLVIEALDPREIAIYTIALEALPQGERHNLADAVGIGLHELGRLPAARTASPRRARLKAALLETLRRQAS
jgi:hypothetical protein